jgi:hypothetical protein
MATSFFNSEKISEWFLDISKYVATGVLITSLLGGITSQWLIYGVSLLVIFSTLLLSMWFSNRTKK